MNTLLLDVGNTRLKWAVWAQAEGPAQGQLGSMSSCCYAVEDVTVLLNGQWKGLYPIDRVLLASVGGAAFCQALQGYVQQRWAVSVEHLTTPAAAWGVINAYAEPQRLGIDRWLALIAARRLSKGPLWVVDCGSAVTIDRLDAGGQHLGGLILPGLAMMAQGLAGVGNLSMAARSHEPGRLSAGLKVAQLAQDTATAVDTGMLTMLVAAIDRIVAESVSPPVDAAAVITAEVTAVIAGGDAARIQPLLAGQWLHQPSLVLQGMALIAGMAGLEARQEVLE